jgi:hypothetical protein
LTKINALCSACATSVPEKSVGAAKTAAPVNAVAIVTAANAFLLF